jgi:Fe-S-cluster containining protein
MSKKKGRVSIISIEEKGKRFKVRRPSFLRRLFFKAKPKKKDKKPVKDEKDMKIAKKIDEARVQKKEWAKVTEETTWECQKCGWCCRQNWRVNVTWKEYDRLIKVLNIEQIVVDPKTGMTHPLFEITDACICLDTKTNLCKIRSKWPYSCATFPFGLDPKGVLIYSKWCKGIGEGKKVNSQKMRKKILKERKRAGMEV